MQPTFYTLNYMNSKFGIRIFLLNFIICISYSFGAFETSHERIQYSIRQRLNVTGSVGNAYASRTRRAETAESNLTCSTFRWKCPNRNKCIWKFKICDGANDCGDNSDEIGCSTTTTTTLATTTITPTGESCRLKYTSFSYGYLCPDGECVTPSAFPRFCSSYCDLWEKWKCADGYCIKSRHKCDGIPHCMDGSDEWTSKCEASEFTCASGKWKCPNKYKCITGSYRCDNYDDCGDNSDEQECEYTCTEWKCPYKDKCINNEFRCDNFDDCGDNSDEAGCSYDDDDDSLDTTGTVIIAIGCVVAFMLVCCCLGCSKKSRRDNIQQSFTRQFSSEARNGSSICTPGPSAPPLTNLEMTSITVTDTGANEPLNSGDTSEPPPSYPHHMLYKPPSRRSSQASADASSAEPSAPFLPPATTPSDAPLPPPPSYNEVVSSGTYNIYTPQEGDSYSNV